MRLKKLGVALLAVVALSAIAVGSASAAATTTRAEWYTGASPGTTLAASTNLKAKIKSGTVFKLVSKAGGQNIELTATGLECVGCTIQNKEITSATGAAAYGTGQINFTGVTAMAPSTCAVQSEAKVAERILTKVLSVHADFMNGTTAVQQFIPPTGTETFANFRLVNGSGTCPIPGLYSVAGKLFADATNPTGTQATEQQSNISPAIETADGGTLNLSGTAVKLTGSAVFFLESGAAFGIH